MIKLATLGLLMAQMAFPVEGYAEFVDLGAAYSQVVQGVRSAKKTIGKTSSEMAEDGKKRPIPPALRTRS